MVDFDLIYSNNKISLEEKFRILNTLRTYSIEYEINKLFDERFRDGMISDIYINQYIDVKDDGSKFYPLLLNYLKNNNCKLDVDIETLHYSFDNVDYELCNLEKGIYFVLYSIERVLFTSLFYTQEKSVI